MEHFSATFKGFDGASLFLHAWPASGSAKGTLLVTHGQAEHSGCYQIFAEAMVPRGWSVVAWDMRGHGKSAGKRGYVGNFSEYTRDLLEFVKHVENLQPALPRPLVLVGHSVGALVTLKVLAEGTDFQGRIAAVTLSSPFLGVTIRVPPVKHLAAQVAFKIWPGLTLSNEIQFPDLTRDQALLPGYATDPLRHDRISPGAYLGFLDAMSYIREHADRIRLPLLMQIAGADRIADSKASEAIFEKIASPKKQKIVYPDSFHEIFNDVNRNDVYRDLGEFLSQIRP